MVLFDLLLFVLIDFALMQLACFMFTVGGNSDAEKMKKSFEIGCSLLSRTEEHPLVQHEAVTCFQRLHLFGGSVDFDVVIPVLFVSFLAYFRSRIFVLCINIVFEM